MTLRDAVLGGDHILAPGISAERANSHAIYLTHWMQFASRMKLAVLLPTVGRIVGMCAKKKMVRIYARWRVALVQNTKTIGDWTAVKLPSDAMRYRRAASSPLLEVTVASAVATSSPQPTTTIWFRNVMPLKALSLRSATPVHFPLPALCPAIWSASTAFMFSDCVSSLPISAFARSNASMSR